MNLLFANASKFVSHGIVVTSWRVLTFLVSALVFNLSAISVWDVTQSKLVYCTTLILVIAILSVVVYRVLRRKAYKEAVFYANRLPHFFRDATGIVDPKTFICGLFDEFPCGISLALLATQVLGESDENPEGQKENLK